MKQDRGSSHIDTIGGGMEKIKRTMMAIFFVPISVFHTCVYSTAKWSYTSHHYAKTSPGPGSSTPNPTLPILPPDCNSSCPFFTPSSVNLSRFVR